MAGIMIHGHVAAGFEPVRDQFDAHFAAGLERGAAVAATLDGELVVDLWAGLADRHGEQRIHEDTLYPVFSCSKAATAVVVALLVGEGRLDYDTRVADFWPAFGAAGKDKLTVGDVLSHQAGLPGIPEDWSLEAWFDWDFTCARLAAMAPMWPPGTGSGYHPITWGYLVGEIVARATGTRVGAHLASRFRTPHGVDVWLGLPDAEAPRAAQALKPPRAPDLGELNAETRAAFLTPWYSPGIAGGEAWRRFELPSASGWAAPRGLARLMEAFARAGRIGDAQVLAPHAVAAALRERTRGPNRVLPYDLSWGAGVIRNTQGRRLYGPGAYAVGHTGFGGSCVLADPERGLAFAYAMTKQSPALVEDARAQALIGAVYGCL